MQSFAAAAAESMGSGSSSGYRQTSQQKQSVSKGSKSEDGSRQDESQTAGEQEVQSPLKAATNAGPKADIGGVASASKKLVFQATTTDQEKGPRKRKSKQQEMGNHTLDLNMPVGGLSNALVSVGLVSSRVSQMDGSVDVGGGSMVEGAKKQKRGTNQVVGSAAAADGSPRRQQ
jgi:hypothetical protein